MFRPAALVVGCATVVLGLNVMATARQTPAAQTPVFRAAIDLVHLDVSVLDKDRRPIRGLTAADFTVLEDGKPQPIVAFSAVDVPDPEPPAATWVHRVVPDVQTNEGAQDPEGRLFVLLMDDAMIPPHPGSLETARQVAKKFVGRVTPADRVAVVFSASGRNQNFTGDRARLMQAIDSMDKGYATHLRGWETASDGPPAPCNVEAPGPKYDPDIPYRQASMRTLEQVAETLISAPQRRKALVFVSPGIAVDDISGAIPTMMNSCVRAVFKESNQQLVRDMTELFVRMQRANVTIYPIDPSGFGGFESYVLSAAATVPALNRTAEPTPVNYDWLNASSAPPGFAPRPQDLAKHMATTSIDFLKTAASSTGGLAVINTNDFDTGLDRIFRENSSYYLIGYQQPLGLAPNSLHRLTVKVNRPDATVRTRSGYYTDRLPKPDKKSGQAIPISPLDTAIMGAVPSGAFPMRVVFAPIVVPGRKNPTVTIALGLQQPGVSARTKFSVDLQTNAYTPDGRPKLVGQRHVATVVLAPSGGQNPRYDLLSEIDLPPGRYELRLSAFRNQDKVTGSLYGEVEVPDFAKAPLSVSGVFVETLPGVAAAPPGAFGAYLPVVPTSVREFRQREQASVFLRIYQGGKAAVAPVTVVARVMDKNDKQIGEGKETLAPDRFYVGGRAADYVFGIPLSSLPPGPYLVTFDVTLGSETVRRSVQFSVVPSR